LWEFEPAAAGSWWVAEQFVENQSFRRFVADLVFAATGSRAALGECSSKRGAA